MDKQDLYLLVPQEVVQYQEYNLSTNSYVPVQTDRIKYFTQASETLKVHLPNETKDFKKQQHSQFNIMMIH